MTAREAFEKWIEENNYETMEGMSFRDMMGEAFIAGVHYTCDLWEQSIKGFSNAN